MIRLLVLLAAILPTNGLDLPPEGVYVAAEASTTAERLDPPPAEPTEALTPPFSTASSGGRCVGLEPLLAEHSPGWSVERMSRIAYRESRCLPDARNSSSSATGLLQILASHCPWLARQMGEACSRARLTDPKYNVRAAAVLWREQSYGAWSTS